MQIRDRIKELRRVRAADLRPSPRNWRTHPQAQQDALRGVLAEVGYADALIARELPDGSLELIDGHLRAETTPDQIVPVLVLDVDEAEAGKILATLDPLAAMAEADAGKLDALLREIDTGSEALQQMLSDLAAESGVIPGEEPAPVDAEPQIDRAAELQAKWQTAAGQVWEVVGKNTHRVMCGDSTKADDVARLMGGRQAALCLTDPPYAIGEVYATHDDTLDGLKKIIAGFFPLAIEVAPVALLTPGNANQRLYPPPAWTLAWAVPAGVGSGPWGFSCWQPVLAFGKDPYLSAGEGRRPDFLNRTEGADNALGHPCSKPIGVWQWLIERGSVNPGDLIYDPFLGSGTTLIAAENLGRICYGMEISPAYVAVILQRATDSGMECRRADAEHPPARRSRPKRGERR